MTAVTLEVGFDSAVAAFNGCQSNNAAFELSLCAVQPGGDSVVITALAVGGFSGETFLAELSFTGLERGGSELTLTSAAFEDGSGYEARLSCIVSGCG